MKQKTAVSTMTVGNPVYGNSNSNSDGDGDGEV